MSLFKHLFRKSLKRTTSYVPQTEVGIDSSGTKAVNLEPPMLDTETISGCFISHFMVITGLLSNSIYSRNPVMSELFAAMLSTLEFISSYYEIDIDDERNEILKWFLTPFSTQPKHEFAQFTQKIDARLDFYRSRTTTGTVRGDFLLNEIPAVKRQWPPYRYSVIFCDCIYNPECIKDYDNAPVLLNDIFGSVEQLSLLCTISQEFEAYTKELKSFDF